MVTPIWDKAEAQNVSAYDGTPYKDALAKFAKIMLDDGRSGHTPEHIGRQESQQAPFDEVLYTGVLVFNCFEAGNSEA